MRKRLCAIPNGAPGGARAAVRHSACCVGCLLLLGAALPHVAGGAPPASAPALRIAVFEADATPHLGHPIYPSFKPLEVVQEPLLAKGVILDDGTRRFVLCAVDWCTMGGSTRVRLRQAIAAPGGTESRFCTVHCVHQHSAPGLDIAALDLLETLPAPPPYLQRSFHDAVLARIARAAGQAVRNL